MEIPDIYCDSTAIVTSAVDVAINLMKRPPGIPNPTAAPPQMLMVGCVRMSLETAKLFAVSLKRSLKTHEDKHGNIQIAPETCKALGVSLEEDW